MNWDKLFVMQDELDQYIKDNHDLAEGSYFEEKSLALLVEIGELANETRCFKFWSKKGPSEDDVVIDEYVDGLHFILSLGLAKDFTYSKKEIIKTDIKETLQFNRVFGACHSFNNKPTQARYTAMVDEFMCLGLLLGFDEEAIENAYLKKHEVNYERQDQGY